MDVDAGLLHSGANQSHRASEHAQEAANHLSRRPLMSGMFGEFAAAESFHEVVAMAQAHHAKTLQAHQQTLTTVGTNAHTAATGFTDMEQRNAAQLRAVRPR
jgi:hypothetical protein